MLLLELVIIWDHTGQEKRVIRRLGGTPLSQYGPDGLLYGRPCEVRSSRKDQRYRIMKSTHNTLLHDQGNYVFIEPGHRPKVVSARKVDKVLKNNKRNWYKDRSYPHSFIFRDEVF